MVLGCGRGFDCRFEVLVLSLIPFWFLVLMWGGWFGFGTVSVPLIRMNPFRFAFFSFLLGWRDGHCMLLCKHMYYLTTDSLIRARNPKI